MRIINQPKRIFTLIFMLASMGFAFAQNTVTGTVTDQNGETLIGVTVQVKGTSRGNITNIDGQYTIAAESSDVLIFSFVGFKTVEETVGNRSQIDVVLEEELSQLEEVVVVGYGVQKKKVVTGSIESVKSDEITKTPVINPSQALQGRAAGVQVINQSGQPGEGPRVQVRGIGTDGDNEPLYIVDGMAVLSIANLNPSDIESMEVLKDAATSAIYGARGANGVVLITTKSGRAGTTSISYNGYYGIQNAPRKVDLLNADQYLELMADAGLNNLNGVPFDANEIPEHNTDWQEELFYPNAPITNHELSLLGGNEKTSYASSVSYFNQQGIVGGPLSQFERVTGRLKQDTRVSNLFKWGNSVQYTHIESRGVQSNQSFNGEINSALNMDPLTPVFEDDPLVLANVPYGNNPFVVDENGRAYAISENVGGEVVNPLARLAINNGNFRQDQFLANAYGELTPIENLVIRSTFGMDLQYNEGDGFNELYFLSSTTNNIVTTSIGKSINRNARYQNENTVNYTKSFGPHRFNFLVGNTVIVGNGRDLSAGGQGIDVSNPSLIYLSQIIDSTATAGGAAYRETWASVFGRVFYDFNERVSFSAVYRRDGSSRFGDNNKYGNFFSFGGSWVINEESFFPDIPAISYLKLRGSWGQNGNDRIAAFAYASLVDFNIAYDRIPGAIPAFVENQDIKWETSVQTNAGVDFGLFDNRLSGTVDYYIRNTVGLLQVDRTVASLGAELNFANVGTMRNSGLELSLNWRQIYGDFTFNIGANATYNQNTFTDIASDAGFIVGDSWALAGEVSRSIEGASVTNFFGFRTDGIFQSQADIFRHVDRNGNLIQPDAQPGDIKFIDVNGDGRISDDDRTIIGNPLPDWTLGSTFNVSWKNFDLYALFIGTIGNDIFNGMNRPDIPTSNKQAYMLDRWTEDNPSETVPRFVANDINENFTRATDLINIENGSFVRMRNIQITYNLPSAFLERIRCQNWNFYVAAENLITITGYSGLDPEVGSASGSVTDLGIDRGIYPQPKTFRLGTSITF